MSEKIKVAVRIRSPVTSKNAVNDCCVDVEGNKISIVRGDNKQKKEKQFNHLFWSFDGFRKREDGYLEPENRDSNYADQEYVYNEIGRGLLEHVWEGYNCTLFAYGQTGSGKSYSLMEYGVNKGLLPRITIDVFDYITNSASTELEFQVSFSMLEIYNEKVYDLLKNQRGAKKTKTLDVVQNQAKGLSKHSVSSYEQVNNYLQMGYKNRSVEATEMNKESSRAHTIVTLYIKILNLDGKSKKSSIFNIVDLAGSERTKKSNTKGDRFKEGTSINKSLLELGNVINALSSETDADRAKGGKFASYRNSKLTMLLKDSLGGNSKTVMLATVSPSAKNREETISTLEYASRAMKITNKSSVNEETIKAEMKEVVEQLQRTKEELRRARQDQTLIEELRKEIENLREKLQGALAEKEEEDKGKSDISVDSLENFKKEKQQDDKESKTTPHLLNLNEDEMLNRIVRYFIPPEKKLTAGGQRPRNLQPREFIKISGIGEELSRTEFQNKDGNVVIVVNRGSVSVNGQNIPTKKEIQLRHSDTIMFGNFACLYVFVDPVNSSSETDVTYESAKRQVLYSTDTEVQVAKGNHVLYEKVKEREQEVREANAMAIKFNNQLIFRLFLTNAHFIGLKEENSVVLIHVTNREDGREYIWTEDEFRERYDQKKADFNDSKHESWDTPEKDPFCIKSEEFTPVGIALVPLKQIACNQSISRRKVKIFDQNSDDIGKLDVSVIRCDDKFKEIRMPEEKKPEDIIGHAMYLKIDLYEAEFIKSKDFEKTKCTFEIDELENRDGTREMTIEAPAGAPIYNFTHYWRIPSVTQKHIDVFKGYMIIRVFAVPKQTNFVQTPRGSLAEVNEILKQKEETIAALKNERDHLKTKVEGLQKLLDEKNQVKQKKK